VKIAKDSPAALKSAQAGLTKIRDASKNPILTSLAVDLDDRNIGTCVFMKNWQAYVLDSQDLLRLRGSRLKKRIKISHQIGTELGRKKP
jgi:hypothetical protein